MADKIFFQNNQVFNFYDSNFARGLLGYFKNKFKSLTKMLFLTTYFT
jgi:hypothetical protein